MVHLGLLRLLQGHRGVRVIGAGVLQGFTVQPQPVERVADVVMVVDVGTRIGEIRCAGAQPRQQAGKARVAVGAAVSLVEDDTQIADHFDAARAVQIAEIRLRICDEPVQGAAVAEAEGDGRIARARALRLVPQFEANPGRVEAVGQPADQPAIQLRGPACGRAGRAGVIRGQAQWAAVAPVHADPPNDSSFTGARSQNGVTCSYRL